MKLKEAVANKGSDFDLMIQFWNNSESEDTRGMEEAESLLTASLLNKGWQRTAIQGLMNKLKNAMSLMDVYKVSSRLRVNESVEPKTHTATITIPIVDKKNAKAAIKDLLLYIQRNKTKVISHKVLSGGVYDVGGEDGDEAFNISVKLKLQTKYDRHRMKKILEPRYKIEKLSYDRGDA